MSVLMKLCVVGVLLAEKGGQFTIPNFCCRKTIAPGEEVVEEATLTATKAGTKEIIVRFSSDQLSGLSGACEVQVSYGE